MYTEERFRPIEILLVEDNLGDVRLTQESLQDSKVKHNLHVVTDGEKALDFLHQEGLYSNAVRPDIILLDLNLPRKDGREVLAEIKADVVLKAIPVVVFTTSTADNDIIMAYDLHANSYITKPQGLDQFFEVVNSIEKYWLTIVRLPPRDERETHSSSTG
ncbi:MAG: response regulator [Gammaproteobacteria bacterium]|nr:response regulator [Gammaproteobacteria bacterium]